MSIYGGSVAGQKAIWNCKTGFHAQYYGGPLIGGVPDPMDVQDGAPTTAEINATHASKKKAKGAPQDEPSEMFD
jgi:hypothetical protein